MSNGPDMLPPPEIPAGGGIAQLAEHLFRHESGKLVSVLTSIFGLDRLQLAEDVVQEALVKALQSWPYYGVPKNPAAWLTQTAKNLALDVIRREKLFSEKQPQIISFIENWVNECDPEDSPAFSTEIKDGRLRLMFACCHPLIPAESQTALALKTLCGFSPAEIASAFLTSEAAIAKRLTRARQHIQEQRIPFEIPPGEEMPTRLDGVLHTLYLLFNEGYKASSGENLVREDLCREALRLASLLAAHPLASQPRVHALVALMYFNTARLAGRVDEAGQLLRLEHQDRSKWDHGLIARGLFHFAQSAAGDAISEYHLQAGIAAVHCASPDFAATDWPQILAFYDQLVELDASPVVALNRAVAVARVHGPQAGLDALEDARAHKALDSYYLLHAVLADFTAQLGDYSSAVKHLRDALELTGQKTERALLEQRLAEFEQRGRELAQA